MCPICTQYIMCSLEILSPSPLLCQISSLTIGGSSPEPTLIKTDFAGMQIRWSLFCSSHGHDLVSQTIPLRSRLQFALDPGKHA